MSVNGCGLQDYINILAVDFVCGVEMKVVSKLIVLGLKKYIKIFSSDVAIKQCGWLFLVNRRRFFSIGI